MGNDSKPQNAFCVPLWCYGFGMALALLLIVLKDTVTSPIQCEASIVFMTLEVAEVVLLLLRCESRRSQEGTWRTPPARKTHGCPKGRARIQSSDRLRNCHHSA